jgi:hypothetical protein
VRRSLIVILAMAVGLVLSAGISTSAASTKFAYSSAIDSTGSLTVSFEEAGIKKYTSVGYRLDASAIAQWQVSVDPPLSIAKQYPATASVGLAPNDKGRVSGSVGLDISQSGGPGGVCGCGALQHVEYFDMTITNLATGHVYRLSPISRDFS